NFLQEIDDLIAADGEISYWEFMVREMVHHYFSRNRKFYDQRNVAEGSKLSVPFSVGVVLRVLCQIGGKDEAQSWKVVEQNCNVPGLFTRPPDPFPPHWTVLLGAFRRLADSTSKVKLETINM